MPNDVVTEKNLRGRHPSAHEQFRPHVKKIEAVRKALEPFGLAKDDDKTWSAIRPVIVVLARAYNFRSTKDVVPRPRRVAQSLNKVEQAYDRLKKASEEFVDAIGAVDDVALEWMLAYDDPVRLFNRGRVDADGPSAAPETFKLLRDRVFGREFKEYDRLAAQRLSEFESAIQPAVEERNAAAKDLVTAREHYAQRAAQSADWKEIEQGLRTLDERERDYRLTELRTGALISPSPHFFRDGLKVRVRDDLDKVIRRQAPIVTLAGQARQRFAAAAPKDEGGPSPLLGRSPKQRLLEECCELIFYFFGTVGLEKIKEYKLGDFANLLKVVRQVATGKKAQDDEFSEPLKSTAAIRDQYLKLSAPKAGKKPAPKKPAPEREAALKAAHDRLSPKSPA